MSDTSLQILHGRVTFNLAKRISSAEAAACIKFGVEKITGVDKVHFVGDDIEVEFGVEGAAIGAVLDALAEVGFPSAVVAGTAATVESRCPAPVSNDDANEQGEAIA